VISPEYCVKLAQYNHWQNNGLRELVKVMPDTDLRADRGAFFESILGTLNHILVADYLWMKRIDDATEVPEIAAGDSTAQTANVAEWSSERLRLDCVILDWARSLTPIDLSGEILWHSYTYDKDFNHDRALCVTHFFNHQTHHRGQVHAMMTAAGQSLIDTDLILMPEI
jgi:uncharacterized damage-inducible protein DinB